MVNRMNMWRWTFYQSRMVSYVRASDVGSKHPTSYNQLSSSWITAGGVLCWELSRGHYRAGSPSIAVGYCWMLLGFESSNLGIRHWGSMAPMGPVAPGLTLVCFHVPQRRATAGVGRMTCEWWQWCDEMTCVWWEVEPLCTVMTRRIEWWVFPDQAATGRLG